MDILSSIDVAAHNRKGDLWVIIDARVYDLSNFASVHPGGLAVLLNKGIAGQDATDAFFALHRKEVLKKYANLCIGVLSDQTPATESSSGEISRVPFAEPIWLREGFSSPYYKDQHTRFLKAFRKFIVEVVYPDAQAREEDGQRPSQSVFDAMGRLNIIAMRLGPGKHLHGLTLMDGVVRPEEFDEFHEIIIAQELSAVHARGYNDALGGGSLISLPLILKFGSPRLREIVGPIFAGKKFSCLAVTEAFAGSDVANIRCHATRVSDGWIVNGSKKWITNAMFADYFVTVCRAKTGHAILVVERCEGLTTVPIKTLYSATAGTAYVTYDNVFVPLENTLCYGNGLNVVLSNFNHERWMMTAGNIGTCRLIMEECLKWATQRTVFGRSLSSQPVIRFKLAKMISLVECCQYWLENLTYQMTQMDQHQQSELLAGQLALLKMYASQAAQNVSRDAVQIFGGRGITRTGMGRLIEHHHRTLLIDAVGGGAEDILGDLALRQAVRWMPRNARL